MALYVTATFLAETYSNTWPSVSTTVNGTVNVGSAASDKIIVACIGSIPNSAGVPSALTVDGVPATLYAATNLNNERSLAFAVVALPSSSGTVNFTLTSTQNIIDTIIHWYDVRNADITSVQSGADTTPPGGDYLQVNLNATAHGVVFGLDISFSWPNPDVFTVSDQAWTTELYNNDHGAGLTVYSGYTYPSADDATYLVEIDKVFGTAMGLGALSLAPLYPAYIVADIGSYELTGADATPTRAAFHLVVAEAGSYQLTGTAAYITRSEGAAARREFAIASVPYAVFINETTTAREYGVYGTYLNESATAALVLAAEAGSYELTGTAATATHAGVSGAGGDYFGNRYFGARYFGDRYWGIGAAAAALSIAAAPGSYALTGTAATPRHSWKVTALAGSYAVTGTAATPRYGYRLIATTVGSYSLTGSVAVPRRNLPIVAGVGSYSIAGQPATFRHTWRVIATTIGSYAIAGTDATPIKAGSGFYITVAEPGSYALAGQPATLRRTWRVIATTVGAYSISGQPATPVHPFKIAAVAGSYAISGQPATPRRGYKIAATTVGAYTLTGQPATFRHIWKTAAAAGSYGLTGSDVILTKLGNQVILAAPGSYALSGVAAIPKRGRKVIATTIGTYALAGQPATLRRTWRAAAGVGAYSLTGKPANPRSALTPAPPERSDRLPASLRYHRLEASSRYAIVPEGQRGDSA